MSGEQEGKAWEGGVGLGLMETGSAGPSAEIDSTLAFAMELDVEQIDWNVGTVRASLRSLT